MILLKVLLLVVLAAASITLAAVEAGFYLVKRRRLAHVALQNPRAELVNRYLDDAPTLLMPIHMGTYTMHLAMTVVVADIFYHLVGHWAMPIAFAAMVLYLLVFRLTLPYALVRRNPERSLMVLLPYFHAYARALGPLVRVLRKRAAPDDVAPAEAEERSEAPAEVPPAAVHEANEGRLMDAVARFSMMVVRDVMTPRPDVVAVAASGTLGDLRRLMRETKYSRIPVYGENLDDIVGVVSVRDLVEQEGPDSDSLRPLVRPAFLVPETKRIADLLKELQERRSTFAVVVDEYGGTAGLCSMEDIVEELVGEIKDEYDAETEPIAVEGDGSLLVAGRVNIERLEQALEARLANGEDVGTVGGLVTTAFGRVPRPGESLDYKGFTVEVVDAERKRVNRVRFRRKPAEVS
ncbi:MAG TPA: hemolysin family protein [Vicinamibacteria bacterium]|nr:hemolysin family protein [Vicinamibacteria bacterium]